MTTHTAATPPTTDGPTTDDTDRTGVPRPTGQTPRPAPAPPGRSSEMSGWAAGG